MIDYILAFIGIVGGLMYWDYNSTYRQYTCVDLDEYTLLIGHDRFKNITVDMRRTPHLLITGLSGQGKSRCLKVMLLNLQGKADIVLCNAFKSDFRGVQARRIYGEEFILKYITNVLQDIYEHKKPLYIVIEELGTIKNKTLIAKIQELLCVARHYNIYVIGVIQIATKEELKFKSYFNARVSFKQLDDSAYRVVLGTGVEENLSKQEFVLVSDDKYVGRTYDIS